MAMTTAQIAATTAALAEKIETIRGESHLSSSFNDSKVTGQVVSTRTADCRDVDVRSLIQIVEEVLHRNTAAVVLVVTPGAIPTRPILAQNSATVAQGSGSSLSDSLLIAPEISSITKNACIRMASYVQERIGNCGLAHLQMIRPEIERSYVFFKSMGVDYKALQRKVDQLFELYEAYKDVKEKLSPAYIQWEKEAHLTDVKELVTSMSSRYSESLVSLEKKVKEEKQFAERENSLKSRIETLRSSLRGAELELEAAKASRAYAIQSIAAAGVAVKEFEKKEQFAQGLTVGETKVREFDVAATQARETLAVLEEAIVVVQKSIQGLSWLPFPTDEHSISFPKCCHSS